MATHTLTYNKQYKYETDAISHGASVYCHLHVVSASLQCLVYEHKRMSAVC